jgi:hypothetical protein
MIDIFENLIKILNPNTSEYILYKLQILKKYKPKLNPGAPKKYNLTIKDVLQFKNVNGLVDIDLLKQKFFNIPLHYLLKFCRYKNISYTMIYHHSKKIFVKNCPECNWSGANKVTDHIFNEHQTLLNKIKQLYLNGNSCENIAKMYSINNFTKSTIEEIVNRLGIMKSINLMNRQCPCCEWQGLYFLKHLIESVDCDHENFKKKINNMYFKQKKSTTLISKGLNCDKKFVYAYVKYLKERNR